MSTLRIYKHIGSECECYWKTGSEISWCYAMMQLPVFSLYIVCKQTAANFKITTGWCFCPKQEALKNPVEPAFDQQWTRGKSIFFQLLSWRKRKLPSEAISNMRGFVYDLVPMLDARRKSRKSICIKLHTLLGGFESIHDAFSIERLNSNAQLSYRNILYHVTKF